MLTITDNTTIFIKGFAQNLNYEVLMDSPAKCEEEFIAVITDMSVSGYVKVTAASEEDGKWILTNGNGETFVLEKEPATPRKLEYCKLVKNFTRGLFGPTYTTIFPNQFKEASENIASGAKIYQLVGHTSQGHEIATSSLVKFWTDPSGVHHGLTKSGSHYIF